MQYPLHVNLPTIIKGATYDLDGINAWTYKLNGTAYNLTGCAATLVIESGGVVIATLTSTPAAGITLGGTAGTIAFNLTATQTAALTACADAKYRLKLTLADGVTVRFLASGSVMIVEEVAA